MKKFITSAVAILIIAISAKAQVIYTVENGVTYRVTGTQGVSFNPDGSFTFLGEKLLIPATIEELLLVGTLNTNPTNPPIKYSCGAPGGIAPVNGTQAQVTFHNNICGHANATRVPGGINYSCANINQYLCGARLSLGGNDWWINPDCN